jgi:hypothetical protein
MCVRLLVSVEAVPRQPSKTLSFSPIRHALLWLSRGWDGTFWINGGVAALGLPFSWHGRHARTRAPASKTKSKPRDTAHSMILEKKTKRDPLRQ